MAFILLRLFVVRCSQWSSHDYAMVYDYTHNILYLDIDGLVQERRNSIANAMELRHSCANPST